MSKAIIASSNIKSFTEILSATMKIVCLTGAGVSAESGLPVYEKQANTWRSFKIIDLSTSETFKRTPGLVWEYYHHRREQIFKAQPSVTHRVLADYEKKNPNKSFYVITQNIDGLHTKAGSKNVIELHGSVDKVQCTNCKEITVNRDHPICKALDGTGDPNIRPDEMKIIEEEQLPRCKSCEGLLRPYVVWFGEDLHPGVADKCKTLIKECKVLMVMGTSGILYPGALFAPMVFQQGGIVAEFNTRTCPKDYNYQFYFHGPCSSTVPKALDD